MKISDDRFTQEALANQDASHVFNQKDFNKSDLIGIADKDRWAANQLVGSIGVDQFPENDPIPGGSLVEFNAPDGTSYQGRVASKSGKDYVVEISQGESYLVPPGKLAKVTPESERVKEAMGRYVEPEIEIVSPPAIEMANRCCARIAYRNRRPSDDELIRWASERYPDWRLVDAVSGDGREIGLIFEILNRSAVSDQEELARNAYEDTTPQGGDGQDRGMGLERESIDGTGVEPEPVFRPHKDAGRKIAMSDAAPSQKIFSMPKHTAQALGKPGGADAYEDLTRAARWVLARFNDSNPEFYAVPQESEMAGVDDARVVRLSFTLQKKDGNDLNHMYISRSGKLDENGGPGTSPARGFVQVDSEGNLPMVMLHTSMGPESVQEYGFNFSAEKKWADYDACKTAADEVLATYGGYSSDAHAEFEARLVKLGVDDKAKEYWGGYFKEYGGMLTRDIPKKKHESTDKPKKKSTKEPLDISKLGMKKQAIDQKAKDYWTKYFGSGAFNDGWYGEALVRDIEQRGPSNKDSAQTTPKEAITKIASDYQGYIKKEDGQFCVKSKSNTSWSGGCYDTQGEAEKRLKQVEMFKHMAVRACMTDGHIPTRAELGSYIDLAMILKERTAQVESAFRGFDKRKKQEVGKAGVPMKDLVQIAQWSMQISNEDQDMYEAIYGLVYDYLRKNPGFLPSMLGKSTLDEEGVGFTLLYALRDSPRAFKKFKKQINKYQKRYQSGQWKEMEQKSKEWRQQRREMKEKEKPPKEPLGFQPGKTKGEPEEELVVELEDEEIELQPEDFTVLDEPKKPASKKQPPTPPPGAAQPGGSWMGTAPAGHELKYESRKKKMIIRQADAGVGFTTHNAPGKDDKEDYDHHERRNQPSRLRTRFNITRMYSTTSSSDNGYILMDIAWKPEDMEGMSPTNVQQQIISYVKGLESNKEYHDFGFMGRPRIMEFDNDAGVARVKVRSSETRGVPTLGYAGDIDEPIAINGVK